MKKRIQSIVSVEQQMAGVKLEEQLGNDMAFRQLRMTQHKNSLNLQHAGPCGTLSWKEGFDKAARE